MTFEEWSGGASAEELRDLQQRASKKFWFFLLLSIIPVLNWVTMGCAIFCYNNVSIIKSRGRSNGSNFIRLILMIWALFIPPIIVVQLCARIDALGTAVLGWKR